jgi:hypothetical protein
MISSAIPARLQFQCGHAALVTLPRVKGESAAQRNERIGREKSNALSRQCDFCAPEVEIAVNGNHHTTSDVHVFEAAAAEAERPELVVVAEAADLDGAAELSDVEPVAALEASQPVAEDATPEAVAEDVQPEAVAETTEPEPAPLELVAEERSPEPVAVQDRTPAPKRRAPQTRRARAAEVARGRRFLVEYRVERVLHAVDIHDALRQAAALGAQQLTAITRED